MVFPFPPWDYKVEKCHLQVRHRHSQLGRSESPTQSDTKMTRESTKMERSSILFEPGKLVRRAKLADVLVSKVDCLGLRSVWIMLSLHPPEVCLSPLLIFSSHSVSISNSTHKFLS